MHHFACDSHCINNIIRKTFGWLQLNVIVFFEGQLILEAVLFKIQHSWVSLPHQSQGGLYWKEDVITSLLKNYFSDGRISKRDFYKNIFCALNNQLASLKDSLKKNKQIKARHSERIACPPFRRKACLPIKQESLNYVEPRQIHIHWDSKTLQFFANRNSKNRLFIRSDHPLAPYIKMRKVISELHLKHHFENQIHGFSSSVRRKIRKAKRNGIIVDIGSLKDVDVFYKIYRQRIHELGSFGLPKIYFQHLCKKKMRPGLN